MFYSIDKSVLLTICDEINKDIDWSFLDHFDDDKFFAFHGESDGIIWMIKFYYELETIGIIQSTNNEVGEEEIFDFKENKNICKILNIPFKGGTTKNISNLTKKKVNSPKKIEILDAEIQKTLEKNKKDKKKSYKIIPALLLTSIILINIDWKWIGWILLITSLLYFLYVRSIPLTHEDVKSDLIKKEKERLEKIEREERERVEKIEREERERELERKRKEEQERQFKINQEQTGFKLSKTFLTEDKFDGTVIVSTIRYSKFKSKNISDPWGVNQSINLYDSYFTMPSVRISLYKGLWCSVLMIQKEKLKEFFIEFHFRSENLTNSVNWNSEPSCENSSMDILFGKEKFSQEKIQILLNDKEENKRDLTHSKLYLKQTFRFQIDEQILKKIGQTNCKIRLSNFPNVMTDSNHWEFSSDMSANVKNLVREFVSEMS